MNDGTLFQAAEWVKAEVVVLHHRGSDGESVDLGKLELELMR